MDKADHDNEADKIEKRLSKIEEVQIAQETRILGIINNIYKYSIESPNKDLFFQAVKSIINYLFRYRITVIITSSLAAIVSIASLIVSVLTMDLLSDQNNRIIQQNQLLESDRRSSLVFLFNNIMDALDNELKYPVEDKELLVTSENHQGKITKQLAGRIIAISRRLKPYKLYEYEVDSLTVLISPERGQLLINLLESNLDTISLSHIYKRGDFSYAQLDNYTGTRLYLKGINLSHADLSYCTLIYPSMEGANLSSAKLEGTRIVHGTLGGVDMRAAYLKNSSILNSNAYGINLKESDLTNAAIAESDLQRASFVSAKIDSLRLIDCDLNDALFYRFHHDTIISHKEFIKILKVKKVSGWEGINEDYTLSKKTIPLVEYKNGVKTINLTEKIDLRTGKPHPMTYDFRLSFQGNHPKLKLNFYDKEKRLMDKF